GSQGEAESRDRGYRDADNEDSDDNDVHHSHVEPQQPEMTCQTANNEAADPRVSGNAVPSSDDDGGDEVRHACVIPYSTPPPPNPDEQGSPPSMPLEGEEVGQQLSRHADEAAMHLERPRNKSNKDLKGETGERIERASGNVVPSLDDNGGDENVHHGYIVPNSTPPPHQPCTSMMTLCRAQRDDPHVELMKMRSRGRTTMVKRLQIESRKGRVSTRAER
ncbi:hypothetical protein BDN67DRAFT_984414, partial [Paxillus ammoniavirescens]